MTTLARALPGEHLHITTDTCTEPFWRAAQEHRLVAPRCADCGTFRMPPRPFCPECQSKDIDWTQLPGTATVYSFAICNRSPFSGEEYIYVPVVVDLDGAPGARLVSNVIGVEADKVAIGMRLQVEWHPIADGWVLPVFRAAAD